MRYTVQVSHPLACRPITVVLLVAAISALGCAGRRTGTEVPRTDLALNAVGGPHRDTLVVPLGSLLRESLSPLSDSRTVIFYDLRARGRSPGVRDTASLSLEADVRDLEAIRAALKLGRMQLLGWSYGGAVAARYTLAQPERVSRLVLVSPVSPRARPYARTGQPAVERDTAAERTLAEMRRTGSASTRPVEYCRMANRVEAAELVPDPAARARMTDVCNLPNEWPDSIARSTNARLSKLGSYDWTSELRAKELPLLIVVGTRDFIPVEAARAWAAGRSDRLFIVEGGGHYVFLEQPRVVLDTISRFLGRR